MLLNPRTETFDHLDEKSREIMLKTVAFFEQKGKKKLKEDYHGMVWYADFIEFLKENDIFSTLLTPPRYAVDDPDARWDTFRNCDFNEVLGFYGLPYWYAWQVTILGLGPIWMGKNEEVKHKTGKLLKDGAIFAFGLSEKNHGADLYSSEMSLTDLGGGRYVADGGKYYIGNGNDAALVSTFAKDSETDEYVFFVVDSQHENYECVQNVVAWQGYVAEYALNSYPITEEDILTKGRDAWDSGLNTINVGKFNLGWGSIGICTHAFYEAITHAAHRNLYGKFVTDFPHIQQLFVDAYARLTAMKMFASRASDYMRGASPEDRRYLLYNPMVKMKVTTQGEEVINMLWDVIAARGFEKDTYFEMAAREIRALPKLEGTVHVNMALVIKFMANYFFNPDEFPEIPKMDDPVNDDFMFNQGPTRGLGKIRFHDYNLAYDSVDLPNINRFKEQIALLKKFLMTAPPEKEQIKDIDFLLNLGELFTLVAYGQLIIEKSTMEQGEDDLLEQIFDVMIRDFSKFALQIYSKPGTTDKQMALCMKMIKKPISDRERFLNIWQNQVYCLEDTFEMNPQRRERKTMAYRYDKPDNLVDLIETSVKKHGDLAVFGTKNSNGDYEWITYRELGERIDNLRGGLAQVGVNKGDGVGIIANNRTEWAICAYASYGLCARFIPMYENELEKIWKYIINDSGVKVLLVSSQEIYEKVTAFKDEIPAVEKVFIIDAQGENTMAEMERMGEANPVKSIQPKPSDIAVLIYTSGTTGTPKGVLLSHGNFTTNVHAAGKLYPQMGKEDRGLSILPWAHSFGQTAELYFYSHVGGSVAFIENVTTIGEDMEKVQPTYLIAVPKIFNKIYDGLWTKMNETGGLAKMLFVMGVDSAKKRRELALEEKSCFLTDLKFKLADAVVFKKIRQRFGGRLKGTISGSATMNVEISHFFSDIGVPVYDCYGLTETTPAASMNCPTAHRPGSVGRAIDQVRLVIDKLSSEDGRDDGEIIVYGPNVMQGYHNNPEATKEVMTEDGGFRTGDRGRLDDDGYLFITGRIKEQYKLVNGKYVFPTALEEEMKLIPLVETVMVYGDGRDFNIALVIPDFVVLEKYAKENNLPNDHEALVQNPQVQEMIANAIRDALKGTFGGYEIPRKFIFLKETFSFENGMLTQTMKLKRRNVLEQYMPEIESLYKK